MVFRFEKPRRSVSGHSTASHICPTLQCPAVGTRLAAGARMSLTIDWHPLRRDWQIAEADQPVAKTRENTGQ